MKNKKALYLTQAAMIAALYVVLTMIANAFGLASGSIQVRFSEALTVLPFLTPAAVPGLFIGCLAANLATGAMLPDIIFGSLATLLGACLLYTSKGAMCRSSRPTVNAFSARCIQLAYHPFPNPAFVRRIYYFTDKLMSHHPCNCLLYTSRCV